MPPARPHVVPCLAVVFSATWWFWPAPVSPAISGKPRHLPPEVKVSAGKTSTPLGTFLLEAGHRAPMAYRNPASTRPTPSSGGQCWVLAEGRSGPSGARPAALRAALNSGLAPCPCLIRSACLGAGLFGDGGLRQARCSPCCGLAHAGQGVCPHGAQPWQVSQPTPGEA